MSGISTLAELTKVFQDSHSPSEADKIRPSQTDQAERIIAALNLQERYDFYLQALAKPFFGETIKATDTATAAECGSNETADKLKHIEGLLQFFKDNGIRFILPDFIALENETTIPDELPDGMPERLRALDEGIAALGIEPDAALVAGERLRAEAAKITPELAKTRLDTLMPDFKQACDDLETDDLTTLLLESDRLLESLGAEDRYAYRLKITSLILECEEADMDQYIAEQCESSEAAVKDPYLDKWVREYLHVCHLQTKLNDGMQDIAQGQQAVEEALEMLRKSEAGGRASELDRQIDKAKGSIFFHPAPPGMQ